MAYGHVAAASATTPELEHTHRNSALSTKQSVKRFGQRRSRRSSPGALAQQARARIEQLFRDRISLATLAGDLGVSREHLCRSFRSEFGLTITDYIRARRIRAALSLVEQPELQLKEVGYAVGFGSYNEFFRAFKRVVRMTPTAYLQHLDRAQGERAAQAG